jgi:hypothetical protein
MGLFDGFAWIFDGFLEPDEVIVFETEEARVQRLESGARWIEAQRMAKAEKQIQFWKSCIKSVQEGQSRCLVEPVLGQEEIHFVGENDGGTYREPPRTDQELLRIENSVLRREEAAMRGKVRLWRWLAGIGAGWILADIVRFFW